jgi:peptide/nickel transport system substrate-binding protein
MISAVFSRLNRWLVLLILIVLSCQIILTSCDPTAFKSEAAQVSQWVTNTISDPKTFNYAFNQEFASCVSIYN